MALNSAFREAPLIGGIKFGTLTIAIGHATFCIVVVYNNVVARLRRTSRQPRGGVGRPRCHPLQTFRYVTFPAIRTALLAGALLAFALSFDEIIVTTFTAGAGVETLPIWILQNYSRPNQGPIVNAVGLFAILLSIIPVYLAQRLTERRGRDPGVDRRRHRQASKEPRTMPKLPELQARNWIGGQWVEPESDALDDVVDPATGEVIFRAAVLGRGRCRPGGAGGGEGLRVVVGHHAPAALRGAAADRPGHRGPRRRVHRHRVGQRRQAGLGACPTRWT